MAETKMNSTTWRQQEGAGKKRQGRQQWLKDTSILRKFKNSRKL
jgi:hypothetical protein